MSTTDPTTEMQRAAAIPPEPSTPAADSWMDRLVDRANPILVKEVRQAMKGRGFVITFMLLVACCWIIAVMGALNAGSALEYFDWAQAFFCWFFLPLTAAIGLVVPFLAYSSMLNERLDDTFEMLSITTLNARRIVNGKLTNALVLILMFFSGITPFIAFTSLLQGFRLTPVFMTMTMALLLSIGLCTVAIFVSTLSRRSRMMQALLSLGLIFGLLACCSLVQILFEPSFWNMTATWQVWLAFGILCLAVIGVTFLVREMAIAQITFESDNRATGVRLVASIIFCTTLLGFAILYYWPLPGGSSAPAISSSPAAMSSSSFTPTPITYRTWRLEGILYFCYPLLALVLAVSYFSCTEPPKMSRRVLKQVQRRRPLLRNLFFPWMPGCYRGYVFCLLHVLPIGLLAYAMATGLIGSRGRVSRDAVVLLTLSIYGLAYFGFACALSASIHRARKNKHSMTTYVRATFVAFVALLAILPHLIALIVSEFGNGRTVNYSIMMASSPIAAVFEALDSYRTYEPLMSTLVLVGGIALALFVINLPGIRRSFIEMHSTDPTSQPESGSSGPPPTPADSLKPEVS